MCEVMQCSQKIRICAPWVQRPVVVLASKYKTVTILSVIFLQGKLLVCIF